jgi:hypothetical protein
LKAVEDEGGRMFSKKGSIIRIGKIDYNKFLWME